jgi:hypothetical protein
MTTLLLQALSSDRTVGDKVREDPLVRGYATAKVLSDILNAVSAVLDLSITETD